MTTLYSRFREQAIEVLHGLDGSLELYTTRVVYRPMWCQRLFQRARPVTVRLRDIDKVVLHGNKLERMGILTIYPVNHEPLSIAYICQSHCHQIALDIKDAIEKVVQARAVDAQVSAA